MHYEHHIPWIQDLRGFLLVMSEERGNISTCANYKDPYKCWEVPANDDASTVKCLAPKRGTGPEDAKVRKPSNAKPKAKGMLSEGYVYYQLPKWVKETCAQKGIQVPFEKIVLHRLVYLAHLVLENLAEEAVPTDKESSHLCGNPWCWLHVQLETPSVNQMRGPCFDPANARPCDGHGTDPVLYCIRSKAASSLIPELLVDGKDERKQVELGFSRDWWDRRNSDSGKNAIQYYQSVRAVGGKGRTGLQIASDFISKSATVLGSPLLRLRRPSE